MYNVLRPRQQDRAVDGDAQDAADGNGRPVEAGGGHQLCALCAQSLGWTDAVPQMMVFRNRNWTSTTVAFLSDF